MGDVLTAGSARAALGSRIRAERREQGRTLRALAAELGVSPATLSAVETGRTGLSALRLSQVAALLDVPVDQLLARDVTPAPRLPRRVAEPTDWRAFGPLALDAPLAGALQAFLGLGYSGASMRDIGRLAGLSVPGLYHHYSSKQDMLVALLDLSMNDLLWRTRAARAEGAGPVDRFRLLVEALALFHTHYRELGFIGASEMRSLEEPARARVTAARVEQQRMVDAEVLSACHQGSFATTRPREAARAVVTMCTALPQWFSPHGPATPEQVAQQYVEFALGVVRHDPNREALP